MAKPIVVGIDPSIRKTALAWSSGREPEVRLFKAVNDTDSSVPHRFARYEEVVYRINQLLTKLQPAVIIIEGFSFGSPHRANQLAEFGGILRWHLLEHTSRVYECAPTTLKKFVTGKGAGTKALIQAHVQKRWERMFETDDEADAYGICRLGMTGMGYDKPAQYMVAQAQKVFGADFEAIQLLGSESAPAF